MKQHSQLFKIGKTAPPKYFSLQNKQGLPFPPQPRAQASRNCSGVMLHGSPRGRKTPNVCRPALQEPVLSHAPLSGPPPDARCPRSQKAGGASGVTRGLHHLEPPAAWTAALGLISSHSGSDPVCQQSLAAPRGTQLRSLRKEAWTHPQGTA